MHDLRLSTSVFADVFKLHVALSEHTRTHYLGRDTASGKDPHGVRIDLDIIRAATRRTWTELAIVVRVSPSRPPTRARLVINGHLIIIPVVIDSY